MLRIVSLSFIAITIIIISDFHCTLDGHPLGSNDRNPHQQSAEHRSSPLSGDSSEQNECEKHSILSNIPDMNPPEVSINLRIETYPSLTSVPISQVFHPPAD
jgi:hypothetical protein